QEAGRVGAVDEAVVVGEGQVDDGADGDHFAEGGVVHHDRALDHGAGAEDADLAPLDDRGVEQGAAAARVGHGERAARQQIRTDLPRTGPVGQLSDLAGQAAQVEVA